MCFNSFSKILVNCQQQALDLDLPFYDIFAPQKVPFLKISDDIIACNLWFGPSPQSQTVAMPMVTMVTHHRLQSHLTLLAIGLFFGLELVLVMIGVGAKFRL